MGLFGTKKKNDTEKETSHKRDSKTVAPKVARLSSTPAGAVLLRPHVTEKSAQLTARGVYSFEVAQNATKKSVAQAGMALYKVTPVKVALVRVPTKRVILRTRRGWGTKGGLKKAYVYLKKGDRIEFAT